MSNIPNHLGIILDGNRRWAKEKGLPALEGHRRGKEVTKKVVKWCKDKGIKILTLFVFSTENWKRPKKEVDFLMNLLEQTFNKKGIGEISKEGIRIKIIGQREKLSSSLQKKIKDIEETTKNNKNMVLNFALSYGGRAEIIDAVKNIVKKGISPDKINEEVMKENLWTSDVDLVIRTGKEQRVSNFLIWQAAYSELYFPQKYWPEFTEKDLDEALKEYSRRQRRFGE
jgi:undecaprenyl diphosphate synthase